MCGRFTLKVEPELLYEALELGEIPNIEPRYNIAPTQPVAVVTDPAERKVDFFRWGLIPFWAKDSSIGNRLINARAETVAEKPAFRAAFARRRCLVLADGFYEWQSAASKKGKAQPYYFRLASGDPFAFAGLWEQWRDPAGEEVYSCTFITCPANERVAPVHPRNPVILTEQALWDWLDPDASPEALQELLRPYPAEAMEGYPVSTLVNSPTNELPELIEPVRATG